MQRLKSKAVKRNCWSKYIINQKRDERTIKFKKGLELIIGQSSQGSLLKLWDKQVECNCLIIILTRILGENRQAMSIEVSISSIKIQ